MLSLIGAATSEPPMPAPFLTLIAACRPVQMGDFGIGSVLNGEFKADRLDRRSQKKMGIGTTIRRAATPGPELPTAARCSGVS